MSNTVPHIAVVLHVQGDPALERQVALWTEACRIQLREHVAPAWGDWAEPPGVFYYGTAAALPADQAAVVGIFRDAGNADAAGYHLAVGDLVLGAVDLSRSQIPSRTLSHEVCEIYRNAYLDEWLPGPAIGREYAVELCDPVQRIDYTIRASLLGESADVVVGDFVGPGWFDLPGLKHQTSWTGAARAPFHIAPGGYQIALEGDRILYLPARDDAIALSSITRPLSRTKLISDGVRVKRRATP